MEPVRAPHELTRREWLEGLAALGLTSALGPQAGAAAPVSTFGEVAWALTGLTVPDRAALQALGAALTAKLGAGTLARLAAVVRVAEPAGLDSALAAAGLTDAATTVVRALYTGMIDGPKGPVVITYSAALAWQACRFTKPPAECGGGTNYWAEPPSGDWA
jgi:Membrane bound FAD containing D-sorbitol dehydrogenase